MTNYTDPATFLDDIPLDIATAAHNGTSHTPDVRGRQERESYANTLAHDYAHFLERATTDDKRAALDEQFDHYRTGYRVRYVGMLASKSRCMSTMITGGSNFPTRRNQKASDRADKRTRELIEFRKTALEIINKAMHPELRPVMAGDADATERLADKIAEAEAQQERMKAANLAIRKHAKAGPDAQIAALVALGFTEGLARAALEPDELKRVGFPSYQLQNNSANIRRMKERLASISAAQATPDTEAQGERARFEDSAADNRVRLFFPGKPDESTRSRLKSRGFRWTPSLGCWQAYRNPNTLEIAKREAGITEAA